MQFNLPEVGKYFRSEMSPVEKPSIYYNFRQTSENLLDGCLLSITTFTILSTKAELFHLRPNRGKSFTGPARG